MTQAQLVTDLSSDAVLFALAGSVAFLAAYVLLARGWRSEIGRALITLDTGIILALSPAALNRLFGVSDGGSLGYAWYFFASVMIIGCATWWRAWFVVRVQWRDRHAGGAE